ncbi:hypothetical protein ACCO45_006217 [Purpureocillium lilacinum]|uniref:Uncharacterized protein n=1 Tax=Purpureocillium lilacinum TaxID=33203 RepID=A0ACC4E0G0_PURLI
MPSGKTLRALAPLVQRRAFSSSQHHHASGATASEAASRMLDTFAGAVSIRRQVLDANQVQKLALTLGRPTLGATDISTEAPRVGTPIPAGYHLPFTRRMWAGGRMSWPDATASEHATLRVGDEVEERTRLVSATPKKSRGGGEMVLVEVEKELCAPRGHTVVDRRSWIFRPEIDPPVRDVGADASGFPVRQLCWSPVGLFRFSALTFNGHKIHFNEEWSQRVEGHPGVVVHGPLNLINILDYWRDVHGGGLEPASISYRAMSPIYAGETYKIKTERSSKDERQVVHHIIAEKNGTVCMKAEVASS